MGQEEEKNHVGLSWAGGQVGRRVGGFEIVLRAHPPDLPDPPYLPYRRRLLISSQFTTFHHAPM